eukprot:g3001.t1
MTDAAISSLRHLIRTSYRHFRRGNDQNKSQKKPTWSSGLLDRANPSFEDLFLRPSTKAHICSNDCVREISDAMLAVPSKEAFGIDPSNVRTSLKRFRHVTYMHVYEDPLRTFSIGIFIIPPDVSIPLHDHPGMNVWTRVLAGTLECDTYDWIDKKRGRARVNRRNQRVRATTEGTEEDRTESGGGVMLLSPDCDNLHAFRGGASEGCAILDVIAPPYDEAEGRVCTYYRPCSARSHSRWTDEEGGKRGSEIPQRPTLDDESDESDEALSLAPFDPPLRVDSAEIPIAAGDLGQGA